MCQYTRRPVGSPNVDRLSTFITVRLRRKFATKSSLRPYLIKLYDETNSQKNFGPSLLGLGLRLTPALILTVRDKVIL